MNTEPKKRANPDYTASAVNLKESVPEVELLLAQYHQIQGEGTNLETLLRERNAELYKKIELNQKQVAECEKMLREHIIELGSFQNPELGWYAVQQKVVTVSYLPDKVHDVLPPAMVAAVIVESVDKKTVEALVKAGRIAPEQQEAISLKSESFKFIIR